MFFGIIIDIKSILTRTNKINLNVFYILLFFFLKVAWYEPREVTTGEQVKTPYDKSQFIYGTGIRTTTTTPLSFGQIIKYHLTKVSKR